MSDDLDRIEGSMAATIEVLRGERELFLRQRDEALVSRNEAWAQRDRAVAALREVFYLATEDPRRAERRMKAVKESTRRALDDLAELEES